jgi:undecaprenyl-diphosphatase
MNQEIFYFFYNFAHQSVLVDNIIVFFAEVSQYLFFILAGLFLLFHHEVFKAENPFQVVLQKYRELSFVFVAGFFGWFFAKILKVLIHAERPFSVFPAVQPLFLESSFAFPSSHATIFMALAVALFFKHKKAGYFFIIFAFLIGISRIASGVHSPVDILGGFILGTLVAFLTKYLYSKFAYLSRNV